MTTASNAVTQRSIKDSRDFGSRASMPLSNYSLTH
jgi:hypothetical protein